MERSDQDVRSLVREVLDRHVRGASPSEAPADVRLHVSHWRLALPPADGPCVIEPSVPCTHCGYCLSLGH
jgi:hypothetical protein